MILYSPRTPLPPMAISFKTAIIFVQERLLQLPDLSEDLGHGLGILDLPVPEQRDQDVKKVLFIFVLYVVLLWTFSHILMISSHYVPT